MWFLPTSPTPAQSLSLQTKWGSTQRRYVGWNKLSLIIYKFRMHYSFIQTHVPSVDVVWMPTQCWANSDGRELQMGCVIQRRLRFVRVWGRALGWWDTPLLPDLVPVKVRAKRDAVFWGHHQGSGTPLLWPFHCMEEPSLVPLPSQPQGLFSLTSLSPFFLPLGHPIPPSLQGQAASQVDSLAFLLTLGESHSLSLLQF